MSYGDYADSYTSSRAEHLSEVLNLYFMVPYPDKYCVTLPKQGKMMQGEERHYYGMYVWEDVWPLSLASSLAPHVTHPLGPTLDRDRKSHSNETKREQKKAGCHAAGILPALVCRISICIEILQTSS